MGVKGNSIKPLKLCRKCGKNLCLSGYCSFCRDKDERAATIKAREEMDRKAFEEKQLIKADIYVDVDGVLFCRNGEILELRDGAVSFLKFLTDNFENVYWLTCWHDGFNDVLRSIYAGHIAKKMKTARWQHCDIDKASGIQDWNRPFVWIEDGLCAGAITELKNCGCWDNYINVPFDGEMHILYDITEQIKKRFNIN
jgi:hypothetical protein